MGMSPNAFKIKPSTQPHTISNPDSRLMLLVLLLLITIKVIFTVFARSDLVVLQNVMLPWANTCKLM
jgi:hypothetical protein